MAQKHKTSSSQPQPSQRQLQTMKAAKELKERLRAMHKKRGLTQPTQEEVARALTRNLSATVRMSPKGKQS